MLKTVVQCLPKFGQCGTNNSKVFGVGLSKTGTLSLAQALETLGFKAAHWQHTKTLINYVDGKPVINPAKLKEYDAFADIPVSRVYRKLDTICPGSKFILTVRETGSWLQSIEKHVLRPGVFGDSEIGEQLHLDLYGSIEFHEEGFKESYNSYVRDVMSYFRNREQDLLVINICAGEGWEKLCPFLKKPVPEGKFPRAHAYKPREANQQ